jgi:hypothetical protein
LLREREAACLLKGDRRRQARDPSPRRLQL